MANLNKVFLIGRLTRDPELRYTPGGSAVCDIGLAVNREWKRKDSDTVEKETMFVDIVIWGRKGEVVDKYFKKGSAIFIEGRLQLDQWETNEGQKRSKLKVVADNFEFQDSKRDEQAAPSGERQLGEQPEPAPAGAGNVPAGAAGGPVGSDDDDAIPF